MHRLVQWFGILIGACYAAAMEQAITSLPYDALDVA